MCKKTLLLFLILIATKALQAQQYGLGLSVNDFKWRNIRVFKPYFYYQSKSAKEFSQFSFNRYYNIKGTRIDTITSTVETFREKYKYLLLNLGYTKNYQIASFYQSRLKLWAGYDIELHWYSDYEYTLDNIGYNHEKHGLSNSIAPVLKVSYSSSPRWAFDLGIKQSSPIQINSYGRVYYEALNDFWPPLWADDINSTTYNKISRPFFQLSARYTLSKKRDTLVIDKKQKPSNIYYGFGGLLMYNNIPEYYYLTNHTIDAFGNSDYIQGQKFNFVINVYKLSNYRKTLQEFYVGKLYSEAKMTQHVYYADKPKQLATRHYYKGGSIGYNHYRRCNRLSNRYIDIYTGFNFELSYVSNKLYSPDTLQYTIKNTNMIGRIYPSAIALWKWSERLSLEARITPHIARGTMLQSNYVAGSADPNYGRKTTIYPYGIFSSFLNYNLGLRYSLKVIKPKRVSKQGKK